MSYCHLKDIKENIRVFLKKISSFFAILQQRPLRHLGVPYFTLLLVYSLH